MQRESKCELTDRLRREGRFDEFKKRREELKAAGNEAKDAWFIAAAEFPPQTDPATGSAAIIKPNIRWSAKVRRALYGARSDTEWLLMAMNVRVPASMQEYFPERCAMLMELRANPVLRADFHRLILKRLAEKRHCFPIRYEVSEA